MKQEYVFEREFTPGSVEFRLRGGLNASSFRKTGYFPKDSPEDEPTFAWRPGWELGAQAAFHGRGGFVTINCEVGLTNKFVHAKSAFTVIDDTITSYKRDGTYSTMWLHVAAVPEISFKRDGRFTVVVGPYLGVLIGSRMKGTLEPAGENKLFKANNDFKKTDIGLIAGFQYKLNFGKKDIGGKLGLRTQIGLSDLDNLYTRGSSSAALGNGRISLLSASLHYSFDLLKL
ncbi:MAG: outer membrane beta-barrel protein [Lewinellaceae bacterium]|nr:outer membrane beta-barrel protein [Lewinellaceae bacterium]